MIDFIEIVLVLLISVGVTLVIYSIVSAVSREKHLHYIKDVLFSKNSEIQMLLQKDEQETVKQPFLARLRGYLLLAGFKFSLVYFFIFLLLVVASIDLLFAIFLKHWSGFIIGIPFGILIVYLFIRFIIRRRKKEFNRALALAISVLVKMMKNGIGFEQALLKSISVSSSKLLREVFSDFFQEKNTVGEMQAFENMYVHVDSKELKIFALAIKIGRESGGQFSNTLAKVEDTINYRKKMQDKVNVVTREGNVGTYVVVAIAGLLYFMLNANFDGKIHQYFMESEYGRFELLGIMLWVFFGMIANSFITRVEK